MKVCDKTCIFCFFPINKYLCMAKRSLLSERSSYFLVILSIIGQRLRSTLYPRSSPTVLFLTDIDCSDPVDIIADFCLEVSVL